MAVSEKKLCKDCKHYRPSISGPLSPYWPDICAYSVEKSPVDGGPLLFVPEQWPHGKSTVLEIRQQRCKGEWFEASPPKPAKPWWRFW